MERADFLPWVRTRTLCLEDHPVITLMGVQTWMHLGNRHWK